MQVAQAERMMELLPLAAATIKLRRAHPVAVPTFRGANMEAQTIGSKEWINSGPYDTGKTYGCTWRLDSFARETPHGLFAIVRKVRADYNSSVRKRWESTIRVRGGVEIRGGGSPSSYVYTNGAEVLVLGLDRDTSLLSGEFDGIYVNQAEELDLTSWETLSTRASGRGCVTKTPMLFGDCNPGPSNHWILERAKGRLKLLASRHADNPELYDDAGNLTPAGVERLEPLKAMTGVRYERFFEGKWVAATGAVYPFDRAVHLIPRASMPACQRHVVSIDFGFANPFVAQLWAIDNDGRMYLSKEIYMTGRTVEQHAQSIKAMCAGKMIEAYVADPADAEGRATLRAHGIATRPAMNAISDGVQAVQTRMAIATDGKPRLFYVEGALVERDERLVDARKPTCTLDEVESYVWPKDSSGRPKKEEPVKENDHGQDAKRYAVKYVDAGHVDGHVSVVYPRATSSHPTAARVRLF
jgi:phage terminase large subunit